MGDIPRTKTTRGPQPTVGLLVTSVSNKNIWASIFGWRALFRWDVLGAIVPGFFIAVGVGILTIDWFPHNLLIGQMCFFVAGLLVLTKTIGHTVENRGSSVLSRIVFLLVISIGIAGVDCYFIWQIQIRKLMVQASPRASPPITLVRSVTGPNPMLTTPPHNGMREVTAKRAQFLADEILDYEFQRERVWQSIQEQMAIPRPPIEQESDSERFKRIDREMRDWQTTRDNQFEVTFAPQVVSLLQELNLLGVDTKSVNDAFLRRSALQLGFRLEDAARLMVNSKATDRHITERDKKYFMIAQMQWRLSGTWQIFADQKCPECVAFSHELLGVAQYVNWKYDPDIRDLPTEYKGLRGIEVVGNAECGEGTVVSSLKVMGFAVDGSEWTRMNRHQLDCALLNIYVGRQDAKLRPQ